MENCDEVELYPFLNNCNSSLFPFAFPKLFISVLAAHAWRGEKLCYCGCCWGTYLFLNWEQCLKAVRRSTNGHFLSGWERNHQNHNLCNNFELPKTSAGIAKSEQLAFTQHYSVSKHHATISRYTTNANSVANSMGEIVLNNWKPLQNYIDF